MKVRFYTNFYSLITAFTLGVVAMPGVSALAASASSAAGTTVAPSPSTSLFHVARKKGYFEYRSDIPLVEQFIKRWNAKRRS